MRDLSAEYGLQKPATNPTTIGTVETLLDQASRQPAPDIFRDPQPTADPIGTPIGDADKGSWSGVHTSPGE